MIVENAISYEPSHKNWLNNEICPECGGVIISVENSGDMVCSKCGLVIEEKSIIFSNNITRTYNQQEREKKLHTGDPISKLLPYFELTTYIDKYSIQNPDLRRAVRWDNHMSWEKKNMVIAITELKRIASNLNFPKRLKEGVVHLYRQAFKRNIIRGRSIRNMIAACSYYLCKKMSIPITFQEILNETAMNAKQFMNSFSVLVKELNLKTHTRNATSLIPKYCQELGLDHEIEKLTTQLLKIYLEKDPAFGKNPKGICAGAIYYISKLKNRKIRQKQISEVAGTTEVTLRARYKELMNVLIK